MIETWHLVPLFATGLVAGFVDSIAGGGGLITLPVLLSFGLGPQQALGTNKLQATFGSGSAAAHYAAAGTVPLKDCVRGFALSALGAVAGALAVSRVETDLLRRLIPILLVGIAVYLLVRPKFGTEATRPRMRRTWFDLLFGLGLGFYDGFFGPGTGTFWTMAYMLWLGFPLMRATGYTKVVNFASNLSSLVFFLASGQVLFAAGLVMGLGQLLGARLGSRMAIRRGAAFIRPVFLTVVLALAVKLSYQAFLQSHGNR